MTIVYLLAFLAAGLLEEGLPVLAGALGPRSCLVVFAGVACFAAPRDWRVDLAMAGLLTGVAPLALAGFLVFLAPALLPPASFPSPSSDDLPPAHTDSSVDLGTASCQ
jgi:hypothetical protein